MILPSILKKNQSSIIIAFVFALSIFAQSLLFHYLIYHEILFSSLWTHTVDFFRFYLPHISIALFLASFVFLFKNKWWMVALSVFIDVWIWANLWYFRANNILIDKYAIGMIGNLNGFWNSILALIQPVDFVFLCITISIGVLLILIKRKCERHSTLFSIVITVSIICGIIDGIMIAKNHQNDYSYINPFKDYEIDFTSQTIWYVNDHSVIHYLAYTALDFANTKEEKYTLTDEEENRIRLFINDTLSDSKPKHKLIICIIESFNKFLLTEAITPNLYNFIHNTNSILYCQNITSQVVGSPSADGQMIIQTGILPIRNGATCFRHPFNTFPSIAGLYKDAGIFPHDLNVWNQGLMSNAYNIDTNVIASDDDIDLFTRAVDYSHKYNNVMVITLATHYPCTKYADKSELELPEDMPWFMKNLIKCMNVTDKGLNILLSTISNDTSFANTTLVITADHRIRVPETGTYGVQFNYSEFIPLIIYSPEIKEKTIITDTCYQMDIYPTILHLIGCEDYYWKGFGVNLLDSTARHNRPITPEEAYDLSDKMIRADYFRKFEKQ